MLSIHSNLPKGTTISAPARISIPLDRSLVIHMSPTQYYTVLTIRAVTSTDESLYLSWWKDTATIMLEH